MFSNLSCSYEVSLFFSPFSFSSVAWSVHVLIFSSRTWSSGRPTCCPPDSSGKSIFSSGLAVCKTIKDNIEVWYSTSLLLDRFQQRTDSCSGHCPVSVLCFHICALVSVKLLKEPGLFVLNAGASSSVFIIVQSIWFDTICVESVYNSLFAATMFQHWTKWQKPVVDGSQQSSALVVIFPLASS